MLAKETHIKYGISIQNIILLIFQESVNIAKIVNQRRIISIKPSRGFLKPKKSALHKILKTKFNPKTRINFRFRVFSEFTHVKYKDIAIKMNKIFHTIGKT